MTTHQINTNPTFISTVTVRESDKYTKDVYIKFERNYVPENIRGSDEFFVSPDELEALGNFLVEQAENIRYAQDKRTLAGLGLERL